MSLIELRLPQEILRRPRFEATKSKFDFLAEVRRSFAEHFKRLEAKGGDLTQTMCFVWYLDDGEPPAQS